MQAAIRSAALTGVDAIEVRVEATVSGGLPAMYVVGLPDAAVREARERVRAALRSCGAALPPSRVVVNLAPADVRKEGPAFDLPIALAILATQARLPARRLADTLVVGELGLDGRVRPVRGIVAAALTARRSGCRRLLLPAAQAQDAAVVPDLELVAVPTLEAAIAWCRHGTLPSPEARPPEVPSASAPAAGDVDVGDIAGQAVAKRALEIAAAGGHHLLLVGPPGGGKSMLARALPGLLAPLDDATAMEVARLHSIAGTARAPGDRRPPVRAPHHASSVAGILGSERGPGELSLAHGGVLLLDELPEFDRRTLEALRGPLEAGRVTVARAHARTTLPASVQVVATANPCPCGFDGDRDRACRCHTADRRRYASRLSGPMLDRFDLRLWVPRSDRSGAASADGDERPGRRPPADHAREGPPPDGSPAVAARVAAARALAVLRSGVANGLLTGDTLERLGVRPRARRVLDEARERGGLGERGAAKALRVARTVADLAGCPRVEAEHVAEALAYRWEPQAVSTENPP